MWTFLFTRELFTILKNFEKKQQQYENKEQGKIQNETSHMWTITFTREMITILKRFTETKHQNKKQGKIQHEVSQM